jgi:O-antigen biosynthesis protein
VCFEALEHVREHEQLIGEAARVLRQDGVLLLSTPERETYNAYVHEPNPFHLRELSRTELLDLLEGQFAHVALWGQSGVGGSRLSRLDEETRGAADESLVHRREGTWADLPEAPVVYLLATASQRPLRNAPASSYLLDPTAEALRERDRRVAARDGRIQELKAENAALYRELERLRRRSVRGRLSELLRRLLANDR